MRNILFNDNYPKLHNQCMARLIDYKVLNENKLNEEFIKYDCQKSDGTLYKLDKNTNYILMYFIGDKFIPFTTIRKYNDKNIKKCMEGLTKSWIIMVEKNGKD